MGGVLLYTYEGRCTVAPKFAGMRGEWISHHTLSLADDLVVIRDTTDERGAYIYSVTLVFIRLLIFIF